MTPNRRQMFAAIFAAAAVRRLTAAAEGVAIAGKRPMILHNDRPEDLETPLKYFDSWLTPVDTFFVRQHLPRPPKIDPATYRLKLSGMVGKETSLTLAEEGVHRREPGIEVLERRL